MSTIFSKIINDEIPSSKIYEDKDVIAILDINPNSKGHSLVIPKQESECIYDTDDEVLAKMIKVAKKVALKMKETLKCEGVNLIMNNKPGAGQIVPHIHVHVVPRFANDGLKYSNDHKKYFEGEMQAYADKLRIDN